eukprot:SAG25_NODE_4825_length_744_cov_0.996899_1_plen_46_part_10
MRRPVGSEAAGIRPPNDAEILEQLTECAKLSARKATSARQAHPQAQ